MEAWKANEAAAGTPAKETPADAKRNAQKEGAAKGYHSEAAPDAPMLVTNAAEVSRALAEWEGEAHGALMHAIAIWGMGGCPSDGPLSELMWGAIKKAHGNLMHIAKAVELAEGAWRPEDGAE